MNAYQYTSSNGSFQNVYTVSAASILEADKLLKLNHGVDAIKCVCRPGYQLKSFNPDAVRVVQVTPEKVVKGKLILAKMHYNTAMAFKDAGWVTSLDCPEFEANCKKYGKSTLVYNALNGYQYRV